MSEEYEIVQVEEGFWLKIEGRVYMAQLTPYKDIPVFVMKPLEESK